MKDPKRLERYQRWKAVFGTPQGESVLADIMKMAGMGKTSLTLSIVDGKVDPYYTIFNDGRQSLVFDILKTLDEPQDMPEEGADDI